jgi:hypothetical protein
VSFVPFGASLHNLAHAFFGHIWHLTCGCTWPV